jgi:hypothetical protein
LNLLAFDVAEVNFFGVLLRFMTNNEKKSYEMMELIVIIVIIIVAFVGVDVVDLVGFLYYYHLGMVKYGVCSI